MSKCLSRVALFAVLACVVSPVLATPLEDKQMEWAFAVNWTDVDDVGSTTNIDGEWQWILDKAGHHEVGALLTYFNFDPDFGDSSDGMILGPVYSWNWTPSKAATGYLTASFGFVSGDLGDFADTAWQGGIGAKVFVGDSAAVRFEYFIAKLMGADDFDDQDSNGISIGISIFTGSKK
jgi:hypothetical protein